MRKTLIFLLFWFLMVWALRLKELYAILFLLPTFLILYTIAEQIDEDNR